MSRTSANFSDKTPRSVSRASQRGVKSRRPPLAEAANPARTPLPRPAYAPPLNPPSRYRFTRLIFQRASDIHPSISSIARLDAPAFPALLSARSRPQRYAGIVTTIPIALYRRQRADWAAEESAELCDGIPPRSLGADCPTPRGPLWSLLTTRKPFRTRLVSNKSITCPLIDMGLLGTKEPLPAE